MPAGKTVPLDSSLDYSSAATVAVTVYCSLCTSLAASLGSAGLVLQALWAVPESDVFVAAESKSAGTFPYWNAGGAILNVYGPQFRLALQNNGSQNLLIQQITIFRRGS